MKIDNTEKIPLINENLKFRQDEKGLITIDIENKGIFDKIAQKLFSKPNLSHIHLDKIGSFIWRSIDSKRNITEIYHSIEEEFGEKEQYLFERTRRFFQSLNAYGLIKFKK